MIELITAENQNSEVFGNLLNQISYVSDEDLEKKMILNQDSFNRLFLQRDFSISCEIYFKTNNNSSIGALKYNSEGVKVRQKFESGLKLTAVPPYLEIADISVDPAFRGQKISKHMYLFILFKILDINEYNMNLLIGGVGTLQDTFSRLYERGIISKNDEWIDHSIFSESEWNAIEDVRKDTIGTKIYSERLGLDCIGSSKTHGGPIYFTQLESSQKTKDLIQRLC